MRGVYYTACEMFEKIMNIESFLGEFYLVKIK